VNFYTIETERLILRKLSPDDYIYVFENYSEQEIKQFLGHKSEEEFLNEKNKYQKGYATYNRSFEYFQLIEKTSNQIIGSCGLHNWYPDHRRAELGYSITNENFKRKGMMSEALKAIISHGFNKMNLHRIEALIGPENTPSLKLMEKYEFIKEGVLREHYFMDEKFENSIIFSKLKSD
jgi:[ribosomal protein S5]-alanine N-acetyltransferase